MLQIPTARATVQETPSFDWLKKLRGWFGGGMSPPKLRPNLPLCFLHSRLRNESMNQLV